MHATIWLAALLGSSIGGVDAPDQPPAFDAAALEFFEAKVRPLLAARCWECHGGDQPPKGGLRLDSRRAVLAGGDTGPAAISAKPKDSLLIDAINYGDVYQMPPKGKLPPAEVAILTKWVELGLPWPESAVKGPASGRAKFDLAARLQSHWSWKPIVRPTPPVVRDSAWPTTDIDRFILARLESQGLRPAPDADRRTLVRRLSFDLIGLPPTPKEIQDFEADQSPQAVERVVDRLLDSPHFGERWARHWLDLVRFAETRGHEFEPIIPNAWQYRDYVIRTLNADLPYDRFVVEHLAGDLLDAPRLDPRTGSNESILGTGFWFLGEEVHSPVDIRQDEADRLDNRLDVMTKTFLGLTVACARCHDHKFDAIGQDDYYALTGFLLSAGYRQAAFESTESNRRVAAQLDELRQQARHDVLAVMLRDARPNIGRTADYLTATRELFQSGAPIEPPPAALTDAVRLRIDELAQTRQLDPIVLQGWAAQWAAARGDVDHPLHVLTQFAPEQAGESPEERARRWHSLRDRLAPSPAATSQVVQQTIVDYSDPSPGDWLPDGVSFGRRPSRPGDFELGDQPDRPIGELVGYRAARRDPFWFGLRVAASAERDHGSIGSWDRSGRTIRTPTATLEQGRVFFLVRGAGRVYAVVDSHLVVAGPLHGRVLKEWDGAADRWQWVDHDLTPYRGHRVHFEFSPKTPDGPLAIQRVVEAEHAPPLPPAAEWARTVWRGNESGNWSEIVQQFQQTLSTSLDRLAADSELERSEVSAPVTESTAQPTTWLAAWHPGLARIAADSAAAQAAQRLIAERSKLAQQARWESTSAPAMFEGRGTDERLLVRGSTKTVGAVQPRRFLTALGGTAADGYGAGSGRLVLAQQILAENDPYAARVPVNRVWHHLFGRGIVPTVDNFGVLGQAPTHPELLDWLADRFRHEQGWSLKQLIKSIVLSRTYQMSSREDSAAAEADPLNQTWHYMPVRRLQAEAIRDAILATSGRLDRTVLGPPVEVHLTPFMDGRGRPGNSGPLDGAGRRSIYTKVRRNFLPPMMLAFDMPIPFNTMGRRSVSNVPAQALILMNDPFVVEQAKFWAQHVLAETAAPVERIQRMYWTALGRPATEVELADARSFLDQQAERYALDSNQRADNLDIWADLAHVLLNTKEFIFVQ